MLQLSKTCKSCSPVLVNVQKSIETASQLNVADKSSVAKLLKGQSSNTLILANAYGPKKNQDILETFEQLRSAQDHLQIVPAEENRAAWSQQPDVIDTSGDIDGPSEHVKIISSRPKNSSFLEELDDAQFRGRNVIVSVDPKDSFHSLMFDSHVVAILSAHKNSNLCKNIKLGRIQFVDWNPHWMLAPWVCNKVLV